MASQETLIAEIEEEFRDTAGWTGRAAAAPRVLDAFRRVHREEFVPEGERAYAHFNAPLPIGHHQTISQPFIVAVMTELLDLRPDDRVLEIGTGSGYQTAVLAELAAHVFSVETIPELSARAAETLRHLGYTNVELKVGDGGEGWPERAPYDRIIVTAAAAELPPALVEQLRPGGRMVIPVGLPHEHQDLRVVEKSAAGEITDRTVLPVAFVPLIRPARI